MNKFYNEIDININPLQDDYDMTSQTVPHIQFNVDKINPQLHKFLKSRGIKIRFAEIFRRLPGNISSIHSDYKGKELVKINWIYGGTNSTMKWFDILDHNTEHNQLLTTADTSYIMYPVNAVTLVETVETKNKAYLVEVGTPHQINNPIDIRYCVSCVLVNLDSKLLTMAEAQSLLHDLL